jgi:putative ABC transport system substrate-binding protein
MLMSLRTARLATSGVLLLIGTSLGAGAQQAGRGYRIGILVPGPTSPQIQGFWEGLRELGYVEGQNVTVEYRSAHDRLDRLPSLAEQLVTLKVDIIYATVTPAADAAKKATQTIPIVFGASDDPVAHGLVASLARPGGNVTGLSLAAPDVSGKRLELLKEVLPGVSRVAILWNAANPIIARQLTETQAAAEVLSTKLHIVAVRGPDDFESAFRAIMKDRPGALVVLADFLTVGHRGRIAEFAAQNRLPTMCEFREFVAAGCLVAYGPSLPDSGRRVAHYVDRILKGAKPGNLPVEQPTKFELVINMKTAKALGLTIPPSLLLRADHVIE